MRAFAIVPIVLLVVTSHSGTAYAQTDGEASTFCGTWSVTSAQTSVLVSIEPQGDALVVFIREGGHSSTRAKWESFHGGVLVKALPRIRLWSGRSDDEVRAEMEPLPGTGEQVFLERFFMRRVEERQLPPELDAIPLPEFWSDVMLDSSWDETAGRRTFSAQPTPSHRVEPQTSGPDLAKNVLQRNDVDLRTRSLEALLGMLAPDAPDPTKTQGLHLLRQCLTAKFDRAPFHDRVLPMLQSANEEIRAAALRCLPGLGGGSADVPAVAPMAGDSSPIVRRQVASALIQLGAGERGDIVIPALTTLLHDADHEVIVRTIRSMWGQYSSPEFDELLVRISNDEQYRGLVIYHGLSTMPKKSVIVCRRLVAELDDPDWNKSGRAAWGLTYGVEEGAKGLVEEGLLKALPQETNEYTRAQEFRALGNIATSASRAYLESVVASPLETDKIKQSAREILERLGQNS